MRIFSLIVTLLFPTATWAERTMKYLNRGEWKLAYELHGQGKPLFILNGGPGRSSESFIPLAKEVAKLGYQIVLFDQRGTGASKLTKIDSETITLDHMVEDLEALRQELRLEKVSVMGHSFGGMYALAYAAKYPLQVKNLILSESPGPDLSWQEFAGTSMLSRLDLKERKRFEELEKKKDLKSQLEALKILAPAYVYRREHALEIGKSLTNVKFYSQEINKILWKDMKQNYNVKGKFTAFEAPVLIIHGRQDFLGEEVALKNHQELKNSKLEFINECSHYPWYDQPKIYFKLIDDFLKQHS